MLAEFRDHLMHLFPLYKARSKDGKIEKVDISTQFYFVSQMTDLNCNKMKLSTNQPRDRTVELDSTFPLFFAET